MVESEGLVLKSGLLPMSRKNLDYVNADIRLDMLKELSKKDKKYFLKY